MQLITKLSNPKGATNQKAHTYILHCTARLMCVARGSGTSQIGRSADKQLKPAEIPYKNKQKAQKTHKARGRMSSVCVALCELLTLLHKHTFVKYNFAALLY